MVVAADALSIIYITRDAGRLLRASLGSVVPLGAEIVLVDSGSTDLHKKYSFIYCTSPANPNALAGTEGATSVFLRRSNHVSADEE